MEYQQRVQLKDHNSFRTEAFAKHFCSPTSVGEIKQCLKDFPNEEKLIIGGGYNLFFTKDFEGLVLLLDLKGIRVIADDDDDADFVFLEVMASEDWDSFVEFCVGKGFAGLENLSLIPGTVGASPVQNIGAYGAEVQDCIYEVVAVDKETGETVSFSKAECQFGYRDSTFKRSGKYIIVSVVFKLSRNFSYRPKYADLNKELEEIENPNMLEVREAVIRVRQRKLPCEKDLPNAGSFFKNPSITKEQAAEIAKSYPTLPQFPLDNGLVKTSAAFFIDQAGYKGVRDGMVGTYPNQPLIVVNYGTAKGKDIINFMHKIQEAVRSTFKIELEPEVRIF